MSDRELDHFFGALYLETTADLLTPAMTAREVELLVRLVGFRRGGRYADLGCGHGRHLVELRRRGHGGVVGLDRSLAYLRRGRAEALAAGGAGAAGDRRTAGDDARTAGEGRAAGDGTGAAGGAPEAPPFVRGDLRALPFATASLDGAYAWYSGLFLFDEETNRRVLAEAARVLREGAVLVHQGANPARLARDPVAHHVGRTRAGDRVEEVARFDAAAGREHLWRRLTRADGRVLEGGWSIRHYDPDTLTELMRAAGFRVDCLDESGRPFDPAGSLDLVAVARRAPLPSKEHAQR